MKRGVVYIAYLNKTRPKFPEDICIRELEVSIKSLKKIHPNLSATLFTDTERDFFSLFDSVINIENKQDKRGKVRYLINSPYDETLYIDTDTKIVGNITDGFELLKRFDMAAIPDSNRKVKETSGIWPEYANIPYAFGEINSAFIYFRKSEATKKLFELWKKNYEHWTKISGKKNDQPSFRVSLWQCEDLKFHYLPIEYCVRTQDKLDATHKKHPKQYRVFHWHKMYDPKVMSKRQPHKIHL